MPPDALFGAHMSIAGGLHRAVDRAGEHGCTALQIFQKNQRRWEGKELTPERTGAFREAVAASDVRRVVAHASYLINLGGPKEGVTRRSIDGLVDELERADRLGVEGVIFHPGAHLGEGMEAGVDRVVDRLGTVLGRTEGLGARVLLETTAGQGTVIGHRFEQLAAILEGLDAPDRLGVCLDTCHVFAAGYDIGTEEGWEETIEAFDRTVGLEHLRAFHLNDSRGELGSRVDRHDHLGEGEIGTAPFRAVMRDERFVGVPKIIETPKEEEGDRRNLGLLEEFAEEGSPGS